MKSGFVAITGRPNAGKSTLLNKIIGEKVAIVSNKPQTTRTKILGIHTTDEYQTVFIDTPGIHKPHNKLGERMEKYINSAVDGIDVLIYVIDCKIYDNELEKEKRALTGLDRGGAPVILAINKVDTAKSAELLPLIDKLRGICDFAEIIPISAQKGTNVEKLLSIVEGLLPEGPKYFENDAVTDQPERQIAAEMIREKALRLLNREVPHGIAVSVEKMSERDDGLFEISAVIYCEKTSHKRIIIGKGGEKLKDIGRRARQDIERFLGAKVYLELWVKVKEDWRNRENFIRDIGFE